MPTIPADQFAMLQSFPTCVAPVDTAREWARVRDPAFVAKLSAAFARQPTIFDDRPHHTKRSTSRPDMQRASYTEFWQ